MRRLLVFLLCMCSLPCLALTLPLPTPDSAVLRLGSVRAAVKLPDGSVVLGGDFTHVQGQPRSRIAKLAPDGTLDPNWAPEIDGTVSALLADNSGNVFVGGSFSTVNGVSRWGLAKLAGSGTGTLDATWDPHVNGWILAIAREADGRLIVGGQFSVIGGQNRNCIARVSHLLAGGVDLLWNPNSDGLVTDVAVGPGGSIYVSGQFENIGGKARKNLAKLTPGTGSADASWAPDPDDIVRTVFVDTASRVYAGGYFDNIGGLPRAHLARLNAAGAVDLTWNAGANSIVEDIQLGVDGRIYVAGNFSIINSTAAGGIARLTAADGTLDSTWRPVATWGAQGLLDLGDGRHVAYGEFPSLQGQPARGLGYLDDNDATVLGTAPTDQPGIVWDMVRQSDGGIVIAGIFDKVANTPRGRLARFLPDGSLDPVWDPVTGDRVIWAIYSLAVDSSDRIYVAGMFTEMQGVFRNGLLRVDGHGSGAVDAVWDPRLNDSAYAITVGPDASIYVGGVFTQAGGQARENVAKLSINGAGDAFPGWVADADNVVSNFAIDSNGDVFAAGGFDHIGGAARSRLAKLSGSTGAVDAFWAPVVDGAVYALAIDSYDLVYIGGDFTTVNGTSREGLARLLGIGTGLGDPAWNPDTNDDIVRDIAIDAQGYVFVTGDFRFIHGTPRNKLARISPTGVGAADPLWDAPITWGDWDSLGWTLLTTPDGRLYVGGQFDRVSGQPRSSIAALRANSDEIFIDGFE